MKKHMPEKLPSDFILTEAFLLEGLLSNNSQFLYQ